jgi:hypothetical protein
MFSTVALALSPTFPATLKGIEPTYDGDWKSGDAGQECVVNLGYDFGLKIDGWSPSVSGDYSGACDDQGSCELAPEYNNTITISNNDGQFFDWAASPFALGAVVVKGGKGGGANIFTYPLPELSDKYLYSVVKTPAVYEDGVMIEEPTFYDISHASFCWDLQQQDKCYQDETAWAKGGYYNTNQRGSWAMYVEYEDGKTVDLIADGGWDTPEGIVAGTATFSALNADWVKITINLDNTFIFYYDLGDEEEDENLKVQDYAKAPKGNPKVGKFEWKESLEVGATEATIIVPLNNYYGVHLDVAYLVPCE